MSVISNSSKLFTVSLLTAALAACGGGGGGSSATPTPSPSPTPVPNPTPSPNPPAPSPIPAPAPSPSATHTLYSYNAATNSIAAYAIGSNGGLTPQAPFGLGQGYQAFSLVLSNSGKYAYSAMTSSLGIQIGQFNVDNSGNLSVMSATPVTLTDPIQSLAVDPANTHLFAGSYGNRFYEYTISNTGALTLNQTVPLTANMTVSQIVTDPSGQFVYVVAAAQSASSVNGTIQTYFIQGNNLQLQNILGLPVQSVVYGFKLDPSGKYAYLTTGGKLYQYAIQNGNLTPMIPATVSAGSQPSSIAISPNGKYLYVSSDSYMIYKYVINADGTLTPLATSTFKTTSGNPPTYLAVDPSSQALYVINAGTNQTISQYTIGSDGTLSDPKALAVAGSGFLTVR